jgi:cell division initiation protein
MLNTNPGARAGQEHATETFREPTVGPHADGYAPAGASYGPAEALAHTVAAHAPVSMPAAHPRPPEATAQDGGAALEARRLPPPERTSAVTPLDLRQVRFTTALRGFDRAEVAAFLLEVGDGYEQALRENERLRQEIARLESALVTYRELESSLKSTMLTAQRVADGMRESAVQNAARIISDAEARAALILEKAHARGEDVQRETDGLKLKRREAENGLESIIAALQHTLEFVREQERRERLERDKSVPHRGLSAVS